MVVDTVIPMSDKRRGTHPIQVETRIANQIKTIVAHTGESISDYVSPLIRERVAKDYERIVREQLEKIEKEKKQKS